MADKSRPMTDALHPSAAIAQVLDNMEHYTKDGYLHPEGAWRHMVEESIKKIRALLAASASETPQNLGPTSTAPAPPHPIRHMLLKHAIRIDVALSANGVGVHFRCQECQLSWPGERYLHPVEEECEVFQALRAASPSRERSAAPPTEPDKPCADGHVWSNQFGDDWTPEVGTLCDCRQKAWGVSTPPAPAPPTPQPTNMEIDEAQKVYGNLKGDHRKVAHYLVARCGDFVSDRERETLITEFLSAAAVVPAPEGAPAPTDPPLNLEPMRGWLKQRALDDRSRYAYDCMWALIAEVERLRAQAPSGSPDGKDKS